jgi:signal transduction histidine kinase
LTTLGYCRETCPEIPFIFVSGTIGEDAAIDSLLGGATDYVLKQRLKRLSPAIARAMREIKGRKERKALEQKFLQAQKMEVVGQLSGGIAHDFNNLLAVILGHVELLLDKKELDPKLKGSLTDIHLAAESAGNLTRQLLLISRKQALQTKVVDLNRIIAQVVRWLSRTLGARIQLEFQAGSERLPVMADSGMLEQVMMNLVVNARDAMPEGGRIEIKTEMISIYGGERSEEGRRDGKFACLTVADNGSGIPPEVLSRMFDPFFTTKEAGKGTGLGLATVYSIARQHLGWIEVQSQVGKGTAFRIFLPECPESLAEGEGDSDASTGKGTLLVVSADAQMRKQVRLFLEEENIGVLDAASGTEALELSEKSAEPIDLLLSDWVTPDGVLGRDLAEKLKAKNPGLKAIYASRYGFDARGPQTPQPVAATYLPLPYDRQTLVQTVHQCLTSPSQPRS